MIDLVVDFLLIPHLKHMQLLNDGDDQPIKDNEPKRLEKYSKVT